MTQKYNDYTDIELLKKFLTKFGKIKSKRQTYVSSKLHRCISKTIKKARCLKIIPLKINIIN